MKKRKHLLTMRQSAAWRLWLGMICLFAAVWIYEWSDSASELRHPATAGLLAVIGLGLIWGWWKIKRRLERIIENAVAKSRDARADTASTTGGVSRSV